MHFSNDTMTHKRHGTNNHLLYRHRQSSAHVVLHIHYFRPNIGYKDSFAISFNLARVQLGLFVVVYPYEKDVAGVFIEIVQCRLSVVSLDGQYACEVCACKYYVRIGPLEQAAKQIEV